MGLVNRNIWDLYYIGDVLVWARKSPGGGFYDTKIHKTGEEARYLAESFENIAKRAED